MDTMNKSVQSMNLEKVLSELKFLKASTMPILPATAIPGTVSVGQQPELISANINLKPPVGAVTPQEPEIYGFVPGKKKKKKDDEEEPHLMKPSDLFK
jgi:hypothetical protein